MSGLTAKVAADRAYVAENWQLMTDREMAIALGVSISRIDVHRRALGLRREQNNGGGFSVYASEKQIRARASAADRAHGAALLADVRATAAHEGGQA